MAMLPSEKTGAPLTRNGFVHLMSDAIKAAGLTDGVTTHGLRYNAATMLHELGLSWEVIASVTGHQQTVAMVREYTEKKRNARTAIAALDKARAVKKSRPENAE